MKEKEIKAVTHAQTTGSQAKAACYRSESLTQTNQQTHALI